MFKKKGFTLIELMVVIAIIAVLAAVVAPQVFRQVEKGRIASAEGFYNTVKLATTAYFSDMGNWPAPPGGWCTGVNPFGLPNCNLVNPGLVSGPAGTTNWDGPYLDRWPNVGTSPWSADYWLVVANAGGLFGPASGERSLWLTTIPTQTAQRIDLHFDGAVGSNTGKVRQFGNPPAWTAAGNVFMGILISRDGAVN